MDEWVWVEDEYAVGVGWWCMGMQWVWVEDEYAVGVGWWCMGMQWVWVEYGYTIQLSGKRQLCRTAINNRLD